MSTRALVTGGGGFLGRYVVDELLPAYAVTALGRHTPRAGRLAVRYLAGDIRDHATVNEALENIDIVFHVAGNIRTPATDLPDLHKAVNVDGTLNVLNACRNRGVQRLIYVSTCEVYGENAGEQVGEDAPKAPANAYAESKWMAETLCQQFSARGDVCVTVVRPSYIFGHGQFEERLFPRLINAACAPGAGHSMLPLAPGPGGNDFVYVRDVARGTVFLGTRPQSESIEAFNIGSGTYTTVRTVFEVIRDITGADFREGDAISSSPPLFSLSMNKAADRGFVPRYSLRDGLLEHMALARAALDRGEVIC